jgi:hypothetical protein
MKTTTEKKHSNSDSEKKSSKSIKWESYEDAKKRLTKK